ncbi:uncharacterized protein LOC117000414 isoform X4 [Catharus ustulatus]|uniref:uncharacterized protein LOC117000414 isoform X4 n=1 Tax=Catharus ustulatus TaxID=91951 RepID=UPI00140B2EC7|nr:uncharacterized protein LOC117000414 isoform X4 [Catharus ustulatus]
MEIFCSNIHGEGRSSTSMKRVAGWDPICEAAQSPRSRLEKKQHFGTRGTRRGPSGVRHPLWLGYKQIPTESQGAPMKHKISIQISSQPGMVQTWLGTPGSGWLALQAYGEEHCSFLGISQAYSCQQPPGAHRIGLEKISDHRVKLNISVSTRLWHSVPCPDPSLNTSRNSDSTALTARHTLPSCPACPASPAENCARGSCLEKRTAPPQMPARKLRGEKDGRVALPPQPNVTISKTGRARASLTPA